MTAIVVLGSLNIDLVVQVPRFPQPGETIRGTLFETFTGGKGGNQAVAAARLGGAPRVMARVGNDEFGKQYRGVLTTEGALVEGVETVSATSTGTALIEVDQHGQNHIVIVPGANGSWTAKSAQAAVETIPPGSILLLQLEIPTDAVWSAIRTAEAREITVILDPAPAPPADEPIPEDVLQRLHWITPNESEAAAITGIDTSTDAGQQRAARALVEMGVTYGVVKAGARGAWLATSSAASSDPVLVPGFTVTARDTTAAGDSFNGGLAWALAQGHSPIEAMRRANAVAALSTTGMGAQTAMPTAAAVATLLQDQPQ